MRIGRVCGVYMNTMSLFLHNKSVTADLFLTMVQVQSKMSTDLCTDHTDHHTGWGPWVYLGGILVRFFAEGVCLLIYKFALILFQLVQDSRVQHFGLTVAL